MYNDNGCRSRNATAKPTIFFATFAFPKNSMAHQVPEDGTLLPLMEEFYTIQGEGYHTGKAAYFIRLGGCDVDCHWCDVKESWNADTHPLTAADTIIGHAQQHPSKAVVFTGEIGRASCRERVCQYV